jgi:hypothetical protein
MTSLSIKIEECPSCYVCDNLIFKSAICVETTTKKIKLCSKICFEKYCIMTHQINFKGRPKPEKKAGT